MATAQTAEALNGLTHYFGATARCEVSFPTQRKRKGEAIKFGSPLKINFETASRGCATYSEYDPDRDKWILRTESLLTFFHADDKRPAWLQQVMSLVPKGTPQYIPRPMGFVAQRLMANYGPGSITVIQDEHRPVLGEVVARDSGKGGSFFPAYSYFDQYLVVKVMGKTYVNTEPLRVSATVKQWPPAGEEYHSEHVTEFFDVTQPNSNAAFTFGKCTINIQSSLDVSQLAAIQNMVSTLRMRV